MKPEKIAELNAELEGLLKKYDALQVISSEDGGFEAKGKKRVMQGRQEVDGHFFMNTVLKPKDLRLYFFPSYTHPEEFSISADMAKFLKGKSCFHLSRWNDELSQELAEMVEIGVRCYRKDGLI